MNQLTERDTRKKSSFHSGNSKILIVEGEPRDLETLCIDFPVELFTADNPGDALTLAENHNFSLALVKGANLRAFLLQLIETSRNPVLPIIVLSSTDADSTISGNSSVFKHCLFLPYNFAQLADVVSLYISKRQDEIDLNEKSRQLELVKEELESFNYSVSHDLRAPLRAVTGFSKVLIKKASDKLDGDQLRYLNLISDNVDKLNSQVDDLLTLSRLSKQVMNIERIDFASLSKTVYKELTHTYNFTVPALQVSEMPMLNADRTMMQMMLQELIDNALKFSTKDSNAKIEIGWASSKEGNTYYIKDNGIGFDEEFAEKMFSLFQKLHSEDEFDGNGAGLAIVRRIINRHNGKVWAESTLGAGATFYFSIPV